MFCETLKPVVNIAFSPPDLPVYFMYKITCAHMLISDVNNCTYVMHLVCIWIVLQEVRPFHKAGLVKTLRLLTLQ